MPTLDDRLHHYADQLERAAPVSADEARQRADESSTYGGEAREVLVAAPRVRRPLVAIVAAVLALALVATLVKSSSTSTPTAAESYYLPAWVPAGLHLGDKRAPALTPSAEAIATLVRTEPPGVMRVAVHSGTSSPAGGDFTDPVDIGGHPGSIVSGRDQSTKLAWSDGIHSHELTGIGASDGELVETAASIRFDDSVSTPRVELEPPPGWKRLARAWPVDPSASFIYTSDESRVLAVSVFKDAAGLAGELASALPEGQAVEGDGARGVAVASGDWMTTVVAVGNGALAQIDSLAVPEPDVLRVAGSIEDVSAEVWNAAAVEGLHVYPYQPAPGGFVPLVAAGGVTLEQHAGPNGSWCLRIVPAPAASSSGCFVRPGPSSATITNFTTPTHATGRAVFGLTETSTVSVMVELADGTAVDAQLADIEDAQRCTWLAVVPAGATIRAIQATHGDGTPGWRVGRPVRSS